MLLVLCTVQRILRNVCDTLLQLRPLSCCNQAISNESEPHEEPCAWRQPRGLAFSEADWPS